GDFYDFLPYGQGRLGMVLGDVSGKGTAAALFASLAIGIIREHIVDHPCPPAEMLSMLNTRLYAARLDSRFIATTFAVFDAGTRRLTVGNAGGPYPLLFASDGIMEASNAELEEFGFDRLSSVLSSLSPRQNADQIANAILSATDDYS